MQLITRATGEVLEGPRPDDVPIRISLLGGFSVVSGGVPVTDLPSGSQRLLAFLAMQDRPMTRASVAAAMWPDVTAQHAGDSLRSALARLDPASRAAIDAGSALVLDPSAVVDYADARALAHRLLDAESIMIDGDLAATSVQTLSRDLLPDWPDRWIDAAADEWRHLRGSALEALAHRLIADARLAEAREVARAAMRIDPLRETPLATLVRIHLADGNQSDAIAAFDSYRATLREALGIEPTGHLSDLLIGIHADGNESPRR